MDFSLRDCNWMSSCDCRSSCWMKSWRKSELENSSRLEAEEVELLVEGMDLREFRQTWLEEEEVRKSLITAREEEDGKEVSSKVVFWCKELARTNLIQYWWEMSLCTIDSDRCDWHLYPGQRIGICRSWIFNWMYWIKQGEQKMCRQDRITTTRGRVQELSRSKGVRQIGQSPCR